MSISEILKREVDKMFWNLKQTHSSSFSVIHEDNNAFAGIINSSWYYDLVFKVYTQFNSNICDFFPSSLLNDN